MRPVGRSNQSPRSAGGGGEGLKIWSSGISSAGRTGLARRISFGCGVGSTGWAFRMGFVESGSTASAFRTGLSGSIRRAAPSRPVSSDRAYSPPRSDWLAPSVWGSSSRRYTDRFPRGGPALSPRRARPAPDRPRAQRAEIPRPADRGRDALSLRHAHCRTRWAFGRKSRSPCKWCGGGPFRRPPISPSRSICPSRVIRTSSKSRLFAFRPAAEFLSADTARSRHS